jgi:hypothetical protein
MRRMAPKPAEERYATRGAKGKAVQGSGVRLMAAMAGRSRSGSAGVNEMLTWLALARWLAEES